MSSEWSSEQILHFLECYQGEPAIWDPQNNHHKDKKKVHDAWERLSIKLNTPAKDLKMKKDILMGTFRRHLKKKQDSIKSGAGADDVYEPIWFAYPLMESFLLPVYTTRQTINTETEPSTSQVVQESFGDETNESESSERVSSPVIQTQSMVSTSTKRPRRSNVRDPAEQQMATAFSQLTNALSHRQSAPAPPIEDECDLYAKLLATKLRELSKDERKLMMYDIDGIFIQRIQNRLCGRDTQKTDQTLYSKPHLPSIARASCSEHLSNQSSNTYTILPPFDRASNTYSIQPPSVQSPCANSIQPVSVQIQSSSAQSPSSNSIQLLPVETQHLSIQSPYTNSTQPPNLQISNQYSNTYTISPPSDRASNTYSIQPPSVQSPCANTIQPVSVKIQTPSAQSPCSNTIQLLPVETQNPSIQSPYTNSTQPPNVQSSSSSANRTIPRSNIVKIPRSNIINMSLLKAFEHFDSDETSQS